ncbi:MAG: DNA-processing protein DprA [Clostridia bacterium]|nr:DNA-processing protein DprA [Clostridia bacterium]
MKNARYWIWLQTALGYGSAKAIRVLEHFDSVADFYNAGENKWREMKMFTSLELERLKKASLNQADQVIRECDRCGYSIITPDDDQYPVRLLRIKDPPVVLYVWGTLPDIDDNVTIAMVGTRKCTENGLIVAELLGYRIAQAGGIIVSGGAKGIDTACSQGAVDAKSASVIVLGCGLNHPYLLDNLQIRNNVAKNGAVISEYQPRYSSSRYTFPRRNRIMSALALGVVVVESPKKSGSLITADHALEQGKDVYAIPGDIMSEAYAGNNAMLQDGATAVYTPYDILSEYVSEYPHRLNLKNAAIPISEDKLFNKIAQRYIPKDNEGYFVKKPVDKAKPMEKVADVKEDYGEFVLPRSNVPLSEKTSKIYNCFTKEDVTIDILISRSGMDIGTVLAAVTELEIYGLIKSLPGERYKVNL